MNNKNNFLKVSRFAATSIVLFALVLGGCTSISTQRIHGASNDSTSINSTWIATWGASPTVPVPNSPGYENQTLRLIVHATLGGEHVRVRLSNAFGVQPLIIGAASVALSGGGANVVPTSVRAITFNGAKTITIPPGALMVSDPIGLKVAPLDNLAVSLFLPAKTGPVTVHPLATQVSFVSSKGNFTLSNESAAFTTQIQTWPFLSGIEVKASTSAHAIVTFGDSITDGYRSSISENRRWPDILAKRLFDANRKFAVVNEGISGNRLLHDAAAARPIFGPNALSRFDRDVLAQSGVSHVVLLIGINDIGMGSRASDELVTSEEIITGLQQVVVRAHAKGLKIIGATLTPFEQAAYSTSAGEEQRQAVNRWIRNSTQFDGIIDFDKAVRDPNHPAQFLNTYDSGDHLHPNDAGYKAMGEAVDLSLFDTTR